MVDPSPAPSPEHRRRPLPLALLVEARPKQWIKNVLVFAAPGAAGVLTHGAAFAKTMIAFAAFCLAASGTYYLNDAGDVEADRRHPRKRFRPIAAGDIPLGLARGLGIGLLVAGVGVSFAATWQLALVVTLYVVQTTCYTIWLKHLVMWDVVAVASGFAFRAVAGASATGIEISDWFFIVAIFGSLFMVACKREAEVKRMGEGASQTRANLAAYTGTYLTHLRTVTSAVVLVGYCLWGFEKANLNTDLHVPWFQLSIIPFGLAIFRYALLADEGRGGEPEEVVLNDRVLQVLGLVWIAAFAGGIYKLW
ncbi:MAG TPA: decaprenyl-phosphate phosphoribosyltransferase [Acidimicrobiales bacterium]|jgi:decaprenyl-phosphate phosphoribosyltransferase|nr:decaprenyl-phosphate phosphoribosyltransferase [Acidimicrobiales bacterium]